MSCFRFRWLSSLALGAALVIAGPPVAAQVAQAPRPAPVADTQDARKVREDLMQILKKYPPSLGRILKLDPGLMQNDAYLTPYKDLGTYLAQHPEIHRNPNFYLEPVEGYYGGYYRSESSQIWENITIGAAVFFVVTTVLSALAWIVRTLIDYRRWHRLSKVQADAHAKLLDRFTANDELIAYVQSPAGTKFLQSAPITLDPGAQSLGAPFARILWSIQAGLVLGAGGLGLYFVSGRVDPEVSEPLMTTGVLALSLGFGFVASAVVSFLLSKRLGLFDSNASLFGNKNREPRDA
jgi:hypothetical protein